MKNSFFLFFFYFVLFFSQEVSETVDSKLQKTTEKLMESSDLLIDVIKCVSCLSKLADSEIDADNRSTDTTR